MRRSCNAGTNKTVSILRALCWSLTAACVIMVLAAATRHIHMVGITGTVVAVSSAVLCIGFITCVYGRHTRFAICGCEMADECLLTDAIRKCGNQCLLTDVEGNVLGVIEFDAKRAMANRRLGRKREAAARAAQQREEHMHTHAVAPTTPTGDAPHAENERARDCEHASCGSNAYSRCASGSSHPLLATHVHDRRAKCVNAAIAHASAAPSAY